MKVSLLLAGLLAAAVLLAAPRAEAQFQVPPFAVVTDAYNIETNGPGLVFFPVLLSRASAAPVSIRWTTRDGNAKAGPDYVAASGTVFFAPGQRIATIAVPLIGDSIEEPDEFFSVILSDAQGALLLDSLGNTGISDDDYSGTISVADAALPEGNSGRSNLGFRVTLSTPPLHPITFGYGTANGSAISGLDYINSFGLLQFLPGEQSKIVNVPVLGDTVAEANETLGLQLIAPGYAVAKGLGVGVIVNDDASNTSAQSRVAPSAGAS